MSTPTTDEGSFVILSQAKPQNDQVNESEDGQSHNVQVSIPKPIVTFYHGEPEVLGAIQIFVGLISISFGIIFSILCEPKCPYIQNIIFTRVLLWSGALYVVSGSLSLATSIKPTIFKVKSSLVMTMISIAAASFAILMMTTIFPSPLYFPSSEWYCAYYKPNTECVGIFNPQVCLAGIIILLFLLTILIFCITISTSVFACRTVCRSSYNEMSVVIYQSTSLNAPVTATAALSPSTTEQDS
ncbi:membrane-spanning 4-domains subfamily A member 4A-like isoform X1 [Bufo bufo]|uniref:membrane-spanning 4-domains subfamily A member 4A-like isoform X1 n=1 Tax=Bufo bufo TaxID=8384 RepID=UPI001ABE8D7F|nr:membrane-spanning 4-domains subfamily A member 4A-like isoform X1 [Bufo bufo]XP_040284753.1 membrane-spanning 4-domains subfamily A member 4A-like isoform X1 [Bufo bufo]XP_040284762.1 membrane-spanning 4-domains subfamily A member 4A-like isoform X1 [Bufo bufo]XP_040284769.1 membrane-spanning 4-domains subfamily A member 4A-like isoform X1 [Bufo bufo]